jgi:hypothetical protein
MGSCYSARWVAARLFIIWKDCFMPKPKRGKFAKLVAGWRGTCPLCKRTGVRVLWDTTEGDQKLKVCKRCDAQIRNKKTSA